MAVPPALGLRCLGILAVVLSACGGDSGSSVRPTPLATGIEVSNQTSGDPIEDGYTVTVDAASARPLPVNDRIVFSDLETSYRISGFLPVYVAAAPPAHVADTAANRPYSRRLSVNRFFGTANERILDRYHADWLVVDHRRFQVNPTWTLIFSDERYSLYHRTE